MKKKVAFKLPHLMGRFSNIEHFPPKGGVSPEQQIIKGLADGSIY